MLNPSEEIRTLSRFRCRKFTTELRACVCVTRLGFDPRWPGVRELKLKRYAARAARNNVL